MTLIDARLETLLDHIQTLTEVLKDVRRDGLDPWEVLSDLARNVGAAKMLLRGME